MIIKNKWATFVGHKFMGKHYVVVQKWTAPDAPSVDGILASTLLTSAVQTITTGITNPDFPRTLEIDSDEGGATGDVVITGTNIRGDVVTDTIALNGTTAVEGVVAFKTITSIQLPVKAGTESVWVGWGDKLGLQSIPWSTDVESEHSDHAVDTGGTVLTRDSDEIEKCLYDPTTECDGSEDKMIAYLSDELPARVGGYTS
jgi:hypothetical protein